jgi:hypothetical protein
MAHMKPLPEGVADTADWALVLRDGTTLPVHSYLLCTLSSVLAGLSGTKLSKPSKFLVEVPFEHTLNIASAFLCWLYRHHFEWTLPLAKELAQISNFWSIPGED